MPSGSDHNHCHGLSLAFGCRVETVGNHVEQNPGDLLREDVGFPSLRIEGPLQGDLKALLLGPRPVISEIEALLDQGVDID